LRRSTQRYSAQRYSAQRDEFHLVSLARDYEAPEDRPTETY
jgi:hypothetical protein